MIPALAPFLAGGPTTLSLLNAWTNVSTDIDSPGSKAVSPGSDRLLLVHTISRNDPLRTVTGVSYGGEDMTLVDDQTRTPGPDLHTSLWRLGEAGIAAAVGTAFIITSSNTTSVDFSMQAAVYQLVDQASPIEDSISAGSNSDGADPSPGSPLATVDGGIAIGLIGINQGTNENPDADASFANMTELLEVPRPDAHVLIAHTATDGTTFAPAFSTTHTSRAHIIGASLRPA